MNFPSHLSSLSRQTSEEAIAPSSRKRNASESDGADSSTLPPLKLQKTFSHLSSFRADYVSSSDNLDGFSSDRTEHSIAAEVHKQLSSYLHPHPLQVPSNINLRRNKSFRSSTAETEATALDESSSRQTSVTELDEMEETSQFDSPLTSEDGETPLPDCVFQEPEELPVSLNLHDILAAKSIERSSQLFAKGNFGRVYEASIAGSFKKYLYKHYLKPISFDQNAGKFWRQSDFAASRLHDIPHLIKPLFFIVMVKTPDGSQKKFFVPGSKTKEFGKTLPAGSKVFLQGQLMEKASGTAIEALREKGLATFSPDRSHFRNIAVALHDFLKVARPHNFIHRDLSLNNIIYNLETKKVDIIDLGESLRLRSRGKTDATMKNKINPNPAVSKTFKGTPNFMGPAVVHQKEYAAETEAASVALILLNLIDETDFERFSSTRFSEINSSNHSVQDRHFGDHDPSTFLEIYLRHIGPDSKTEEMFQRYPAVKEIIDLAFRASAPGPAGEEAFQAFQHHPYFAHS